MDVVVHLMEPAAYSAWRRGEALKPASLAQEGFVHLCFPSQVAVVRLRFYPTNAVVAVVLRVSKLGAPVVVEDSYGHGAYPHLYGPIPRTAVIKTVTLKPDEPLVI